MCFQFSVAVAPLSTQVDDSRAYSACCKTAVPGAVDATFMRLCSALVIDAIRPPEPMLCVRIAPKANMAVAGTPATIGGFKSSQQIVL